MLAVRGDTKTTFKKGCAKITLICEKLNKMINIIFQNNYHFALTSLQLL